MSSTPRKPQPRSAFSAAGTAKQIPGALGDDAEYERACELFEANPAAPGGQVEVASVLGATAVIWDMPTGTADVWRRGPDFLVVARSWLDDSDRRAEFLASLPPENPVLLGGFKLNSGWAVIMWAADSGEEIREVEPADGRSMDLSVGHAGIVVALSPGDYLCYHDKVTDGSHEARRCPIVSEGKELIRAS
jgi:hypothetical protein